MLLYSRLVSLYNAVASLALRKCQHSIDARIDGTIHSLMCLAKEIIRNCMYT